MVNTRMFKSFCNGVMRVAPRTGILVALDLRDKQKHTKFNCNYLRMREAVETSYTKRVKQLFDRWSIDQAVQTRIEKILKKSAGAASYGVASTKIEPPKQMCCSSNTINFIQAPHQLRLEPEHLYIDMYNDEEVPQQRAAVPAMLADRSVDAEIEAQIEAELPPNVRALVEAQRLQNSLMALMALQQSLINTVQQQVSTASDVQTMKLDTLVYDTEQAAATDEATTSPNGCQPQNVSLQCFTCHMPMLNTKNSQLGRRLVAIAWKNDFQGEAQRIIKVCDDFLRDAGARTAALVRKCLDATSDQRIADTIIKALQELGLLMKRIGQAIMDMINKIMEVLGIREDDVKAKALMIAQTCANLTKRGAEKCKEEAGNCKQISNNIVAGAGNAQKSVSGIANQFQDFGKTVGNFASKLDKESLTAMAFTKDLQKSK